jgi:uncharacterized protein YijF (DUF1287 family)
MFQKLKEKIREENKKWSHLPQNWSMTDVNSNIFHLFDEGVDRVKEHYMTKEKELLEAANAVFV